MGRLGSARELLMPREVREDVAAHAEETVAVGDGGAAQPPVLVRLPGLVEVVDELEHPHHHAPGAG